MPLLSAVLLIDLEVNPATQTVFKIGAFRPDLQRGYESSVFRDAAGFQAALNAMESLAEGAQWLMGHNILAHDLTYVRKAAPDLPWLNLPVIDTLRLSPLLFPQNPYHRLIKNHKLLASAPNSPLADCHACWQLFQDQCAAAAALRRLRPQVFAAYQSLFGLLPYRDEDGIRVQPERQEAPALIPVIWQMLQDEVEPGRLKVCRTRFMELMRKDIHCPDLQIPLAYTLAWLGVSGGNSVLAPWVRWQFPQTARLIAELRDHDCGRDDCRYCRDTLNPHTQLQRYFKLPEFRAVQGFAGGQQAVVASGMKGEHVLAVLPTGGGKSLCFQLPALNRYHRNGGLTIVVSPLQSLMKDQVDNLQRKGIFCAATLNGMLSVTERAEVLDKIALGDIGILFVAPEQFRNKSFISAIAQRQINGWVFDEAHCLSGWGHDFRPDYLYAAKFIGSRRREAGQAVEPVSCFTATAKPDVLHDICTHFRQELGIEFKQYIGDNARSNLSYEVLDVSQGGKKQQIHALLARELKHQEGGAVVFVARRRSAEEYAEFLRQQGWACAHFHAGLPPNEKAEIQENFIQGQLRVIVATNAFGMGVDKPDVRLVVHADITGSLENYLQEAGRAGRDQQQAMCVLLYDRQDVDTQFGLSAASQLQLKDLKALWRKLGWLQQAHQQDEALVVSCGELLQDCGAEMSFDSDDRQADTKVKTALAWLERADLLSRTENETRIFPTRSGHLSLEQALHKIAAAGLSPRKRDVFRTVVEMVYAVPDDELLNTDTLTEATGWSFAELRGRLHELEQLGVLVNDTRMTISLRTDTSRPAAKLWEKVCRREEKLWQFLQDKIPDADQGQWQNLSLTELCRLLRESDAEVLPNDVRSLLYALADDKSAEKSHHSGNFDIRDVGNDILKLRFKSAAVSWEDARNDADLRRQLCRLLLPFLIAKTGGVRLKDALVETSFSELGRHLAGDMVLAAQIPPQRREALLKQSLLFMHKQGIIKLNHGMTILRHAMTLKLDAGALAAKQGYLKSDYRPLALFYNEKRFQIHVMQEYALRALKSLENGWELVRDYFGSGGKEFKNKWFKGRLAELEEAVSADTLAQIADALNPQQHAVVTDKSDRNRLVLAGPGSGKTRVIVHRVAYLLRVRHVDPAAIIVLTFNRLAAQEVKRRLFQLVGPVAAAVTVLTYDGMAMRLLGVRFEDAQQNGHGEAADEGPFKHWCREAAALLAGEAGSEEDNADNEARQRIMAGFRYILVDEYQDISEEHYRLVSALAGRQLREEDDKLTILAVGDDDQNIYAFRDTSNEYIHRFQQDYGVAGADYLTCNYRSSGHIIHAANRLIADLPERLKSAHPLTINPERAEAPAGGVWAERDTERRGQVRIIGLPFSGSRQQRNNIQAQAVWAEIERLRRYGDVAWQDIAVLARVNQALDALQAACEAEGIPYRLAKEEGSSIRLRQQREFVRLLEQLQPPQQQESQQYSPAEFVALLHRQVCGGGWSAFFERMAADFALEYPPEYPDVRLESAFLRGWLYDYVGHAHDIAVPGLFLGTVYRAKGLEFKHVFVLDDGWHSHEAAEQRLYYVAMTRAIETLTLIQHTPTHPWLAKLADVGERVSVDFKPRPEWAVQYHTLSLQELDLGFMVRCQRQPPTVAEIKPRLAAAQKLQCGDDLQLQPCSGGYEFVADGAVVARTSRKFSLRPGQKPVKAVVAAFYVRYRIQEGESFQRHYPEEVDKWPVVIPQLLLEEGLPALVTDDGAAEACASAAAGE